MLARKKKILSITSNSPIQSAVDDISSSMTIKLINNLVYKGLLMKSEDVKITNVDVHKDSSKSTDYSISKSNVPSYSKILVPDDGKEFSDKALNYAISISNLSGAEIVILRIIENIEKMGDTSVSVSQNKEPDAKGGFKHNVGGELVTAMEEKIKKCVEAGAKNKMSYEIKVGHAADQLMKACEETRYDLVVMSTSHLDSWLRSLFSEARKIISKINTPVLLVQ